MNSEKSIDRRSVLRAGALTAGGLGLANLATAIPTRHIAFGELAKGGAAAIWGDAISIDTLKPLFPPREMPSPDDEIKVFDVDIRLGKHEILPEVEVDMFLYNGSYPGPLFRVNEGDWVQVNLTNHSVEGHTIHWHGFQLACEMDGVPGSTQWAVMPGQTYRYLFRAQPAGTHFYHCHVMTTLHVSAGLVGGFIVDPKNDPVKERFPYDREYFLMLSEIDTNYVRDWLNEMLIMGKQMDEMMKRAQLMPEMNGRMMGWFKDKAAFVKAVKEGYIPPYSAAAVGNTRKIEPNYFMINGKAYPMTDEIMIKTGETIRIRLVGAGMEAHSMHLHGHDFWHVCQDGNPLITPLKLNTIPVFPGTTSDIIVQGNNPGHWHFHDHIDRSNVNNGIYPGGMMTMLMYEDAAAAGFKFQDIVQVSS